MTWMAYKRGTDPKIEQVSKRSRFEHALAMFAGTLRQSGIEYQHPTVEHEASHERHSTILCGAAG
jgi:hypothetical protein